MNKKLRFVATSDVKKKSLSRWFTWLFDCLYVDEGSINYAFIKQSISILENNGILCIFVEGLVNPRKYGFFDFKKSYLYLAKKTSSDILPLYIYPDLRPFKKSKIYIGEIVKPSIFLQYPDLESANAYFQSLIMDFSLKV